MTKEKPIVIALSQNGWEDTGYCYVYADSVVAVSIDEAIATKNGVDIHLVFDESIRIKNGTK